VITKEKGFIIFILTFIITSIISVAFANTNYGIQKTDDSVNVSIKKDGNISVEINSNFKINNSEDNSIILTSNIEDVEKILGLNVFLNAQKVDYNLENNTLKISINNVELNREYNLGIKYDLLAESQEFSTLLGLYTPDINNITFSRDYISSISFSFEEPFNKENAEVSYYSNGKYIPIKNEIYYPASNMIFGASNNPSTQGTFANMKLEIKNNYFDSSITNNALLIKEKETTSNLSTSNTNNLNPKIVTTNGIENKNLINFEIKKHKSTYTGVFAYYRIYTTISIAVLALFSSLVAVFSHLDSKAIIDNKGYKIIKRIIGIHIIIMPFIAYYIILLYSNVGNSIIFNYAKIISIVFIISNFIIVLQKNFFKVASKVVPVFWMIYTFFFIYYINFGHVTVQDTLNQFIVIEAIHLFISIITMQICEKGTFLSLNEISKLIYKLKMNAKKLKKGLIK